MGFLIRIENEEKKKWHMFALLAKELLESTCNSPRRRLCWARPRCGSPRPDITQLDSAAHPIFDYHLYITVTVYTYFTCPPTALIS